MTQTETLKVLSPAKINLMLRILGKRADGYHLLQTYFQLLNWGDSIEFTPTKTSEIEILGDFKGLPTEQNLIYQALELLQTSKQTNAGIKIKVEKNIPQGSGLGGGSSNAATTLLIMNDLWNCQLSNQQLQKLGLELGADVPVFVLNQSAIAEGVGENLTPFKVKPYFFVLIFPNIGIATADVFKQKNLKRNDSKLLDLQLLNNPEHWNNSCLPVVLENYPQVAKIYHQANLIAPTFMSGTGSTLFAAFTQKQLALNFQSQLSNQTTTALCSSRQTSY